MPFLTNFNRTFQMVLEMIVFYMLGHVTNTTYIDVI